MNGNLLVIMNKLVTYFPEEIFISEPSETYILRII